MSDWTAGYVADIEYTYGYYTELNPVRIALAFLNAGIVFPTVGTACELGFGQGVSCNVHASASVTSWYGTDFNPSQASFAQDLASASNNSASLFDQAFDQFCERSDLPDFDFIALHGIWSWISDENRSVIVDFLRRKLKVGGVLYISYNTLPGWSEFVPMRHLLTQHASVFGAAGQGIVNRIDGAIDFGEEMIAIEPSFSKALTGTADRLEKLKKQDRHYLAHEYFNRDWSPMYFSEMLKWLKPAKLEFAASANYSDAVDAININESQQKFLNNLPDEEFRQTVRDFIVNQQFRKDYWVKGKRHLTELERNEAIRTQEVILTSLREAIPLKVNGSLGEASLHPEVYNPILNALSDQKPHKIKDIEENIAAQGIPLGNIFQAITLLAGAGHLAPVQSVDIKSRSQKSVISLNKHILHLSRSRSDFRYLVSPLTGGAVVVERFAQLFLLANQNGFKNPEDWAQFVWNLLAEQGQKIVKDGELLDLPQDNLNELVARAKKFEEKQLPLLRSLQIA